jgi:hypothetical protein
VAGAGIAGTALATRASSYDRIVGANDRVGVGIVGYSDRFRSALMPSFHKHSDELNFEFVGVSDIWSMRRDQAQAGVMKLTGKQIFAARNNEELYAPQGSGRGDRRHGRFPARLSRHPGRARRARRLR